MSSPIQRLRRTDRHRGAGGRYLFPPPDYSGPVPEGFFAYRARTYTVGFAFRPVARNGDTNAGQAACAQTLKVYRLADAAGPPQTRFIDAYPHTWNTPPVCDITFFQDLDAVIQREPVLERDKAMMAMFATLGMENGRAFDPDDDFFLLFRLYGPGNRLFDRSWELGDVKRIDQRLEEAYVESLDMIPGPLTGHCLCSAVKLEARELSTQCHVCHCDMCRRWNGGPSLTAVAKHATFAGAQNITVYDSSEWAQRAFCTRCGSHLYYRFEQSPDWYLWAGLFDDQSRFTIAQEIYVDRKPPGYAFAGEHPRLTEDEFLRSIGLK